MNTTSDELVQNMRAGLDDGKRIKVLAVKFVIFLGIVAGMLWVVCH